MTHTTRQNDTERAVSPVIGVILMVAVTVILAAVVASVVFGLTSSLTNDNPAVSMTSSQNDTQYEIVVEAGQRINTDEIDIVVDGTTITPTEDFGTYLQPGANAILLIPGDVETGQEVRVVWNKPDSNDRYTLFVDTVNEA